MTDENTPTDADDDSTDATVLEIFRQQIAHLERAREQLRRMPKAKPADDNPELMNVLQQLQAIREMVDDMEREINERE